MTTPSVGRRAVKTLFNVVAAVAVAPFGLLSGLERRLLPGSEVLFQFGAHSLALGPGVPGAFLRRAFYRETLECCAAECHIGFGAIFTHREVIVERGVYLGCWALVGSAHLREGTSIGSRASLLSGTELHEYRDGQWTPYDHGKLRRISVGPHALIGEGAIVMADVGGSALVSAGAVVATPVPAGVAVAGNPARFVRRMETPPEMAAGASATAALTR
jgi:acetyltransferase-like isoleucine patch superfamily enzyme